MTTPSDKCACGHRLQAHVNPGGCCIGTCPCLYVRTPVRDPVLDHYLEELDHLLEEVAAEVLLQDAAGGMSYTRDGEWLANRRYSVQRAAHAIRSMRAIDMAAGGEQP